MKHNLRGHITAPLLVVGLILMGSLTPYKEPEQNVDKEVVRLMLVDITCTAYEESDNEIERSLLLRILKDILEATDPYDIIDAAYEVRLTDFVEQICERYRIAAEMRA